MMREHDGSDGDGATAGGTAHTSQHGDDDIR